MVAVNETNSAPFNIAVPIHAVYVIVDTVFTSIGSHLVLYCVIIFLVWNDIINECSASSSVQVDITDLLFLTKLDHGPNFEFAL